ncbi:uncharacterized protein PpBr36_06655 [Pyricularia pennisetigena]|uniref:uncharacterized protein n=1 Tax=Pyricularia pennisetigena TaxID=1578925 RepID=UPI0011516FDE|nr:uncharacterized protein PpBr36_06655 [Pyricularia pennisetigena]TLS23154.1 hypothetical protein PpBr36_06655 [Pyricularia pennisetigena]
MPPAQESELGSQGGNNNSSDFVRKLYRMLEDPSESDIVCWSDDGTSFIVKDNDRFTKEILPQHFKHSNFASFVRQLNKYDFHKVRNTDDNAQYGPNAWEFRHTEFARGQSHNFDIIKRKAPTTRKPAPAEAAFDTNQHVGLMNESLHAVIQQMHELQTANHNLAMANRILTDEVSGHQKSLKLFTQYFHEIMNHLENQDERRRKTTQANGASGSAQGFTAGGMSLLPGSDDEPAPELRRAREVLESITSNIDASRNSNALERLAQQQHNNVASPPDSTTSSAALLSQQQAFNMTFTGVDIFTDQKPMVYPVGQTTGIDPFHADHINNIPYSQPPALGAIDAPAQATPPPTGGMAAAVWETKPCILLVEDDKVCQRIGSKFLTHFGCDVETAMNGFDAVSKFSSNPNRYSLIFMDIIMPEMDGVSATSSIRQRGAVIPIIAMTSNIRQEDITTYFEFGMNDVLAKPFTKEGMVRIVKKHLSHMLKFSAHSHEEDSAFAGEMAGQAPSTVSSTPFTPAGPQMMMPQSVQMQPQMATPPAHGMQQHLAAQQQPHHQIKFEGTSGGTIPATPIKFESTHSPASVGTVGWGSPMMNHSGAAMDGSTGFLGAGNGGGAMNLGTSGTQQRSPAPFNGMMTMSGQAGMPGGGPMAVPGGSHAALGPNSMHRLSEHMAPNNIQMRRMMDHQDDQANKRQRVHAGASTSYH